MQVTLVLTVLVAWIVAGGLVSVIVGKVLHSRPRTPRASMPVANWDWHAHRASVGH